MLCPNCAAVLPDGATLCPACGAELIDYLNTLCQPDLLFNEALAFLEQQRWSDACAALCRAHALRPKDAGILALWARSEYLVDNNKRAVELMADLTELEPDPKYLEQLGLLAEEYDREQTAPDILVRHEMERQTERFSGLLDRMERCLGKPKEPSVVSDAKTVPVAKAVPVEPEKENPGKPASNSRMPRFPGRMPDFSQLSEMFSLKDGKP